MDDRYQHQRNVIKAWRWLRYRPLSLVTFAKCLWWWARHGFTRSVWGEDIESGRWNIIKDFWGFAKSEADIRMDHLYTMDEVFGPEKR